jgi:hypothetical protein
MLKSELIIENEALKEELGKLKEEREQFRSDLKEAREQMALDGARLQGSVEQCDLILATFKEEA